ncbi:uncharacterized protein VP01_733g8 [Puccinia sorghi]|uniref:Retrotransposon gag domain-containing protein n=1 Tax=Puccinia sorghi TaxID=27349 RepID=A0A0L6UCU7_9BASI|nr:uncharacterized protein VP01_733g8 [Puccinia sorghi]
MKLFLKLLQTLKQPSSSGPKFCTPGMKPPDKFDGENSVKLQGFLQSYDCKKVLYAALYLGGRASQWFEPYLDLLENQSPSCLINNWDRFEQQLFTLFGDPNESRIDWNNAAFAFHFQKGLPSCITDQLAVTGCQSHSLLVRLNTLFD